MESLSCFISDIEFDHENLRKKNYFFKMKRKKLIIKSHDYI
jgi:hypothetical protein